jgi:hypothetical protein
VGEAERRVDCLVIAIHLGAQYASCEGMIRVARDLDGFSLSHLYDKTTGIRAVIRANRTPDLF